MKFFKSRRTFLSWLGIGGLGLVGSGFLFSKRETMKAKKLLHIIKPPHKHWVGDGFNVHTMFHPTPDFYRLTTPFLLMDYAPNRFFEKTDKKLGVGEHPHRGFETVTFAFEGEIEHKDSAGGGGIIGKGDVQWMTAASGLVHEEFHSHEFAKTGGDFEMVQLWVNLPKADKMTTPRYQGIKNENFPRVELANGVEAKVIAGDLKNAKGPCLTFSPINLFDIRSKANCEFELKVNKGSNFLILNRKGEVLVDGKNIAASQLGIFSREGQKVKIKTTEDSELLVLNGEPIDEPVAAHGPFVMNTKEEIIEAIQDFNSGKMGRL